MVTSYLFYKKNWKATKMAQHLNVWSDITVKKDRKRNKGSGAKSSLGEVSSYKRSSLLINDFVPNPFRICLCIYVRKCPPFFYQCLVYMYIISFKQSDWVDGTNGSVQVYLYKQYIWPFLTHEGWHISYFQSWPWIIESLSVFRTAIQRRGSILVWIVILSIYGTDTIAEVELLISLFLRWSLDLRNHYWGF